MRYNVPVHQSGLYLLCKVTEPSMDPSSTPVEGATPFVQFLTTDIVQVTKGLQTERLKIEGLGAYGTFYSYLLQSVKISLNPFVTCGYLSTQTSRNTLLLLFSKINIWAV